MNVLLREVCRLQHRLHEHGIERTPLQLQLYLVTIISRYRRDIHEAQVLQVLENILDDEMCYEVAKRELQQEPWNA